MLPPPPTTLVVEFLRDVPRTPRVRLSGGCLSRTRLKFGRQEGARGRRYMGLTQSSPARQAAPRAIRAASVPEAVLWASDPGAPFSTPFELSASEGRIWIAPANASDGQREVFYFKGANWVRTRH